MPALLRIAELIDRLNRRIGHAVAWLALFMVLMMCVNVAMRYIFAAGEAWQQELVRFFHAILFLAATGYTLLENEHVRVDVFYQKFPERKKALIDFLGTIFLLAPLAVAIIVFSSEFVMTSWSIRESSPEFHGMPGVFLLKTCIWLAGALLILQGFSLAVRSFHTLRQER